MKFGRNINHVQLSQNLLQREAAKNLRHYRLLVDNRVVDFNGYNQNTKEKTQMKTVDNLLAYKENESYKNSQKNLNEDIMEASDGYSAFNSR